MAGFIAFAAAACGNEAGKSNSDEQTLIVYNAGSLARPIRVAFDSFAAGRPIALQQESAGSLETARKITELGHVPDVIALADAEIFPQFLMPEHTEWYVPFARNRMVIAYRPTLSGEQIPTAANWWRVLDRDHVRVGRSDPARDPNGYRVLITLQLTEAQTGAPRLASRLLSRWGDRYVRATSAELVALLQAGEVDYIWAYESVARASDLSFSRLSDSVDLGSQADSAFYSTARVRIPGASPNESLSVAGAPIRFALSVPTRAPNPDLAFSFVAFLLSSKGQDALRSARLDAASDGRVFGTAPERLKRSLTAP